LFTAVCGGIWVVAVNRKGAQYGNYRICSRNLRLFFSILAAEKSGCVKYGFFLGGLDLGFILV
jgi:hypothetical protein